MPALLNQFETFLLSERKVSNKTLRDYRSDLNNFRQWCHRRFSPSGVLVRQTEDIAPFLTTPLVALFKRTQTENGVPTATVNRRLSTLRNFADFLMFKRRLDKNPLETISNIRPPEGVRRSESQKSQSIGKSENQYIGESVNQKSDTQINRQADIPKLRYSDIPTHRPSDALNPLTPRLSDPLKQRLKTTLAAVSGFGSVFLLIFIIKILFGDSLLGILGVGGKEESSQKLETTFQAPQERPALSFRDLLEEPVVLGTSTQEVLPHGTEVLPAESKEVSIYNPAVKPNSVIQIIPENSIESAIFVANVEEGYFTVAVDRPISYDVVLTWKIIELQ